jgi:hypothetical protein
MLATELAYRTAPESRAAVKPIITAMAPNTLRRPPPPALESVARGENALLWSRKRFVFGILQPKSRKRQLYQS